MKVSYGYASIELRKRECNDVRKRGKLKLKNACAIAGIFILLFPANSAKCFHNDFVPISISDSAHPRRRSTRRFTPSRFTIHHSPRSLSWWRTQWTRGGGYDEGDFIADTRETGRYTESIVSSYWFPCSRIFPKSISLSRQCPPYLDLWNCRAKLYRVQLLHYPTCECQTRLALSRAYINFKGCWKRLQID